MYTLQRKRQLHCHQFRKLHLIWHRTTQVLGQFSVPGIFTGEACGCHRQIQLQHYSFKLTVKSLSKKQILSYAEVFIRMNTLTPKKWSKKQYNHQKRYSIVSYQMKLSAKNKIIMPSRFGSHSTVKHLAIIMTCT